MNVEKLLERLIPYDVIYSKQEFLSVLTPELLVVLKEKINNDNKWRNKAEHEQVFFILDDEKWKWPKHYKLYPRIKISLIGYDEKPVISIYYSP